MFFRFYNLLQTLHRLKKQTHSGHTANTNHLLKLVSGLILFFVLAQTAGLLHAEIHPFHEHTESCESFEQLAQPVGAPNLVTLNIDKPAPILPTGIQLRSVFESVYQPHFFGRAPPLF